MVDRYYVVSLLGFINLTELILLAGGFIAVCIASTGYAQLIDSRNITRYNITTPSDVIPLAFYDIDAYTAKLADQSILMIIFCLTLFTFLLHIIFRLRYQYAWRRISTAIGFLCILYACALVGISIVVACWEDKLRKRLSTIYLNNQYINTPNGYVKPQTGSVAAAAAFGLAACLVFILEALIRFCRVSDKIQT